MAASLPRAPQKDDFPLTKVHQAIIGGQGNRPSREWRGHPQRQYISCVSTLGVDNHQRIASAIALKNCETCKGHCTDLNTSEEKQQGKQAE